MGFTVLHDGKTRDGEYQTYDRLLSRQLLKRGLNLDNLPRVREEGSSNGWLYVWESEADASAFAEDLKKETRDRRWRVQPVSAKPSLGPIRPLQINVGRQADGWVFALEPLTRKALETRFPGSCRRHSVFISSQTRDNFVANPGELEELTSHVLLILTGLRTEQLKTFGNVRVVDPVENQDLLPMTPLEGLNAG